MRIKTEIITDIDVDKILAKRGLGPSNEAERALAVTVKDLMDPYTPFRGGTLKNDAQVIVESDGVYIVYDQPYAHYQYEGVSHSGKPLKYHDAPTRGKHWDKRMMADKGDEVTKWFADYVGGKVK